MRAFVWADRARMSSCILPRPLSPWGSLAIRSSVVTTQSWRMSMARYLSLASCANPQLYLMDTGSAHGTNLNYQKVDPYKSYHVANMSLITLGREMNMGSTLG